LRKNSVCDQYRGSVRNHDQALKNQRTEEPENTSANNIERIPTRSRASGWDLTDVSSLFILAAERQAF
jgi:hypothetical protein